MFFKHLAGKNQITDFSVSADPIQITFNSRDQTAEIFYSQRKGNIFFFRKKIHLLKNVSNKLLKDGQFLSATYSSK